MHIKGEKLDIEDEEFAKGWDPGERWRTQQTNEPEGVNLTEVALLTNGKHGIDNV